jgi:hypothetical protein
MTKVYLNQKLTAGKIVSAFAADMAYVLLLALCQSGKTSTYLYASYLMMQAGRIDHVYVICGSNELVLRKQTQDEVATFPCFTAEMRAKIQVIFRQDFPRHTMDLERTLIILEESHIDQDINGQLDKWLVDHGITLKGPSDELIARNVYFISVSATPYSEIANIFRGNSYGKEIVQMELPTAYRGLKYYLENNKVQPTFSLETAAGVTQFRRMLLSSGSRGKWNLMRVSEKQEAVIRAAAAGLATFKNLDMYHDEVCVDDFKTRPATTTIVFLRDMLRAGKVVPKKHIGFVWEGAKEGQSDTIIQSLLGRMCGYEFCASGWMPLIFLPDNVLKADELSGKNNLERYLAMMDGESIMPRDGRNLKSIGDVAPGTLRPAAALKFRNVEGRGARDRSENPLELYKRQILRALDGDLQNYYTPEQKTEMKELLSSYTTTGLMPALREWSDTCNHNHFHREVRAYEMGQSSNIRGMGEVDAAKRVRVATVTHSALYPEEVGNVYIIFILGAAGEMTLDQRIPKTTGVELFSRDDLAVSEEDEDPAPPPTVPTRLVSRAVRRLPAPAPRVSASRPAGGAAAEPPAALGGMYCPLSKRTITEPAMLKRQVGLLIQCWQCCTGEEAGAERPVIKSTEDKAVMTFSRDHYTLASIEAIFAELEERHRVVFIRPHFRQGATTIYTTQELSWHAL